MKFSDEDRNTVRIINNRLYSAKVLRVNHTTYDMRRGQDSMNPRTHCNVMVLSQEKEHGAHPFWYAQVLGVFHADVLHVGPNTSNRSIQHMEFLWVRWFGVEPDYRSGSQVARLPKIGFVPDTDDSAFGFLDPSLVLRGCHLVPAFAAGRTSDLLQTASLTAARLPDETDDWANYYVIRYVLYHIVTTYSPANTQTTCSWVDRDMFMHYFGGGIGHIHLHNPAYGVTPDEGMDVDGQAEDNIGNPADDLPFSEFQQTRENQEEFGLQNNDGSGFQSDSGSELDSGDESDDHHSMSDTSDDISCEEDSDDLGPEDGENGDDDDDDGYASL